MAVAYVLDDVFAEHRAPAGHPERPERVRAAGEALRRAGLGERGVRLPVRQASDEELGLVHGAPYLADLEAEVQGQTGWLDGDTFFSPRSWEAARAAAGAAVDVTRGLMTGEHQRGLAVVRPPGHHAEPDRGMGFCLLNNVAVAAASARAAGAARVAVLDWDVHHGNGTQAAFYRDPAVLYLSVHQYPFYPGTGAASEIGAGEGRGTTVNVPLPSGMGDAEFVAAFDRVFLPALRRFRPDLILVSAGFDAHQRDPIGGMRVTRAGYRALADHAIQAADELCEGRLSAVLEGGYDLEGLASGVTALLEAMEGSPAREGAGPEGTDVANVAIDPRALAAIEAALEAGASGEEG